MIRQIYLFLYIIAGILLLPVLAFSSNDYPQFLPKYISELRGAKEIYKETPEKIKVRLSVFLNLYDRGNYWEKQVALDHLVWGLRSLKYMSKDFREIRLLLSGVKSDDPKIRLAVSTFFSHVGIPKGCCSELGDEAALVELLSDQEPLIRREAAKALRIYWKNKSVLSALIKQLSDPDFLVQIAVVNSLGVLGPKAQLAVAPLLNILNEKERDWMDNLLKQEIVISLRKIEPKSSEVNVAFRKHYENPYLKLEILKTLIKSNLPENIRLITRAIHDENGTIRLLAMRHLVKLFDFQESTKVSKQVSLDFDVLVYFLQDPDSKIRSVAITALAQMQDARVVPYFVELLKTPDKKNQKEILQNLIKFPDVQLLPLLIPFFSDNDLGPPARFTFIEIVKATAQGKHIYYRLPGNTERKIASDDNAVPNDVESFTQYHHPGATEQLISNFNYDNTNLVLRFLSIIPHLDDDRFKQLLTPLLGHKTMSIRREAIRSLYYFAEEKSIPDLVKALRDKHWVVRRTAAEILGKLAEPRSVKFLIATLDDEDRSVQAAAITALGNINDDLAITTLMASTSGLDTRLRQKVLQSLSSSESHLLPEFYNVFLDDPDKDIRLAAVRYFRKHPYNNVVDKLIELLEDRDAFIRIGAASTLGQTKDMRAFVPLSKIIKNGMNYDQTMRDVTIKALITINREKALPFLLNELEDKQSFFKSQIFSQICKQEEQAVINAFKKAAGDNIRKFNLYVRSCKQPKFYNYYVHQPTNETTTPRKRVKKAYSTEDKETLLANLFIKDARIREKAAKKLGDIPDQEVVDALLSLLQDDFYDVRLEAIRSLGKIGNNDAFLPLIELLSTERSHGKIWRAALFALRNFKNQELPESFIKYLSHESRTVKIDALNLIINNPHAKFFNPVLEFLSDEEYFFAINSVKAISILNPDRSILPLSKVIVGDYKQEAPGNRDLMQQYAAIESLVKINTDTAFEAVVSAVDPNNYLLVRNMVGKLKYYSEDRIVPILEKTITNNPEYCSKIIQHYEWERKAYLKNK